MSVPVPALIDLTGGHSGVSNPWYRTLGKAAAKTWTVPHAQRRFDSNPQNTITVFTAPKMPIWMARLISLNLFQKNQVAPRLLLSSGKFPNRYRNPLISLNETRKLYLDLGVRGRVDRITALHWIQKLLEQAATHNLNVQFIPLIFHWNRSPKRKAYPPVYGFVFHDRYKLLSTGTPLIIEPGVTLSPPSAEAVRRNQLIGWNQESRVIVGNRKLSMRKMIETIQKEPLLNHQLDVIATQGKDTLPTLLTRVSAYVREIAADYTNSAPLVWDKLISRFFNNNFSSIEFDHDGLDELRLLLRQRKKVILTPSHRSHMDYLLISYSIFMEGLACPLVAAGQNLAFWPMGYFFRKTGAFFIRRTFKGLDIYPHVFRAYLWHILSRFQPVEFFIEGGRSRNGAILPAKLGMLNMILEAVKSGRLDDVFLVPLAVNYDRIPEEDSYIRELQGKPKKKERFTSLIRNIPLLKRHFGQVSMATGQPLSLKSLVNPDLTSLEQKDFIGGSVMNQIRLTMPVTAGSLLVMAAMGSRPGELLEQNLLFERAADLLDLIRVSHPNSPLTKDLQQNDPDWQNGLNRMVKIGNFTRSTTEGHWKLNRKRRFQVDYLRNSVMGLVLAPCLVACEQQTQGIDLSMDDSARIICPECHPIPITVLKAEMDQHRTTVDTWSRTRIDCLRQNVLPLVNLCNQLNNQIKSDGITGDTLVFSQWKKLFKGCKSESDDYPEITSTIMRAALHRGFKRLLSGK